jgi:cell division protein FtsL
MTPPSHAGAATAGRLRPGPAPRIPRRVSGPSRRPAAGAARRPAASQREVPALAALRRLSDARLLDRLLRGRAWIAIIAAALLGIVFMQVSLLKLNAGISRAVAQSDALTRQNAELRGEISGLDADTRIQAAAGQTGLVMPAAGDVRYLDARQADAARAARSITAPDQARADAIQAQIESQAAAGTAAGAASTATPTGAGTTTATPNDAGTSSATQVGAATATQGTG